MTQCTLETEVKLPAYLQDIRDAITGTWRTGYEVQQIYNAGGHWISESNATRRIRELKEYGLDYEKRVRPCRTAYEYRLVEDAK